ncbi:hypothetical protein CR157_00770 [Halomonas sp. LBP4]|nr:hypothetical protein CR157_00770 [Halomonas sp. LBP4]
MLNQLRRDHANMTRLLGVLQHRQRALAGGERPDFRLMREVVDYILDYMQGFTVPLERICCDQLLAQVPEGQELSERLASDYRALHERLLRLSHDLDTILKDSVVPMERFADDLQAYLDAHRTYLCDERDRLFPLLGPHLEAADLEHLAEMLPEGITTRLVSLQETYPQLYAELRYP